MNRLAMYSLVLSFIISGCLFAQDVTHFPPQDLTPKEPVFLTLKTKGAGNYSFKCFYKFNDSPSYLSEDLEEVAPNMYQLKLIPPKNTQYIQYYFWVYKNYQFVQMLPKEDHLKMPYSIVNTQSDVEYFSLFVPNQEAVMEYKKNMIIVLKNNFPGYVSLDSIALNETDSVEIINSSNILISLKNVEPMQLGENELQIKARLEDESVVEQVIFLNMKRQKLKKNYKSSGVFSMQHAGYSSDRGSFSMREPHEMVYQGTYNLNSRWVSFSSSGMFDSRDSKYKQPYSRFNGLINDSKLRWSVEVGDIMRRFSPLSLNQKRIRGVKVDVDALKFFNFRSSLKLSTIMGQTYRGVEVSSGNVSVGTFSQSLIGTQLLFSSMRFQSAIHYFKAEDDISSLGGAQRGSKKPIENHIVGGFLRLRPTPLSYIENEFSGSVYYSDTEAPTVNIGSVDMPEFIRDFINKNLTVRTSLTAGFFNRFKFQMPVLSRHHILKLGYDFSHPSYFNTLSSSSEADKHEFSLRLSQKFFNRRLLLNSEYRRKRDNVLDVLSTTSKTDSYRVHSMYRTQGYGSVNSLIMFTQRDQEVSSVAKTIQNSLSFFSCGLSGTPIQSRYGQVLGNLNYSFSSFDDSIISTNSSGTHSYGGSVSASREKYRLTLGILQSFTKGDSVGKTAYLSVFSRFRRTISKQLNLSSNFKFTKGLNTSVKNRLNTLKIVNGYNLVLDRGAWRYFSSSLWKFTLDFTWMRDKENKNNSNLNYLNSYFVMKMENRF